MNSAVLWDQIKADPWTDLFVAAISFILLLVLAAYLADWAGDGPFGRVVRAARDLLGWLARAALFLFAGAICCGSVVFFFLLITRGPERAFGLRDERRGLLIPIGILFSGPPIALIWGLGGELLARARRGRVGRMFAQAAEGTSLTVARIDYPLLELSDEARRGLEFLPESLRAAALFKDFTCRVEAVLKGPVAGVDVEIADCWFTTISGSGRDASSQKHRLTVVAARLPKTDARAERLARAFAQGWSGLDRIDDLERGFDSRFEGQSDTLQAFEELTKSGDLLDPANARVDALLARVAGSPRFGDWLAFGSEAAISDADELRAVISALAATLAPPLS